MTNPRQPLLLFLLALACSGGTQVRSQVPVAVPGTPELHFVENAGQWPGPAPFQARRGPLTGWFRDGGFALVLERDSAPISASENGLPWRSAERHGVVLEHVLPRSVAPLVSDVAGTRYAYLLGRDPHGWRHTARGFRRLRYQGAAPGIDLVLRGDPAGLIAYDLEVAPGADLGGFEMSIQGASALTLDANGDLVVDTAIGRVRHSRPVAWQLDAQGARIPVAVAFRLLGRDRYGFASTGHDATKALLVDPVVTYHGGTANDLLYAVEYDRDGTLVVAGETWSTDFPTTPGAFWRSLRGAMDCVVSRFDLRQPAASQLVFSTYLGGTGDELAFDLELAAGQVFLGGITTSTDFPAAVNAKPGGVDGFIARLDGTGATLLMSRYLGGTGEDWVCSIAVDGALRSVAGGYTRSSDLPALGQITSNAFQGSYQGAADAFVERINLAGTVDYGSYLGSPARQGTWFVAWPQGPLELRKLGVKLHPSGDIVVVGLTAGAGFPVTPGAWSTSHLGADDMFATQLAIGATSTTLRYSTYFGGGPGAQDWDIPFAMDVAPDGKIVLAGCTWCAGTVFPTTPGAIQATLIGRNDHCVSVLDPMRTGPAQLVYSTLLGSAAADAITGVRVDARGFVSFTGFAWGSIPTTAGAFSQTLNGPVDVHFGRIRPGQAGLADLIHGSYYGGSSGDWGGQMAMGRDGEVAMVGMTNSANLPLSRGAYLGGFDGFLTELEMLPQGVRRLGTTSGHCLDGVIFEVDRQPAAAQPLALLTGNAPRGAPGVLLLGLELGTPVPLPGLGVVLRVDLNPPAVLLPVAADAWGTSSIAFPTLPTAPLNIAAQSFWIETGACTGRQPLAASAGLAF